jgi:hypothetical protein
VWKAVKTVLLDLERLERGLDAYLAAEKEKDVGDPEEETRALTIRIAEADHRRAAYQDLVADGLIERDELRAKLDALRRLKAAAEEGAYRAGGTLAEGARARAVARESARPLPGRGARGA